MTAINPFSKNRFTVEYDLTAEYRKQQLIETGTEPDRTVNRMFDLETLTPDQREIVLAMRQASGRPYGYKLCTYNLVDGSAWSGPILSAVELPFDHILTDEELFAEMQRYIAHSDEMTGALKAAKAEWEAKQRADKEARAAAALRLEAAAKAAIEETKAAARQPIEFKDGKAVLNLRKRINEAVTGDSKTPVKSIRHVVGIDSTKKDGFMYVGEFINAGAVEIDSQDKAYLANIDGTIYLVTMRDGALNWQWKATDGRGWALVLREKVQEALAVMPTMVEVPVVSITPEARAAMDKALGMLERRDVRIDGIENDPFALMEALMTVIKEQGAMIKRLRAEDEE